MGILLGMDEAGYGPNFGPLVVAATAWHVDDRPSLANPPPSRGTGEPASAGGAVTATTTRRPRTRSTPVIAEELDLYRRLRNIVAKRASERRIAIADSKVLYHPGLGLRQLERGLHAVLQAIGEPLTYWSAIVERCMADPEGEHQRHCWPEGFDCSLPVDATADELSRLSARFARACATAGVRPLAIRARMVFPRQFNELVAHYNSKGAALSHVTVGLLREVMDVVRPPAEAGSPGAGSPGQAPVYAVCDKHGGRNYYTALLQHHFSDYWIEPVYESHAESRYEWGPADARTRVTFRMNGEAFLPTALASMTAKYLRELAMRAFNQFWSAHVPDLRPTAGYYGDSRRFKKAIAAAQQKLGIDDHVLWRER